MEPKYFVSKSRHLFIKCDKEFEIEIDNYGNLKFERETTLGEDYYFAEGYKPITRSQFDLVYIEAIRGLNEAASL